MTARGRAPVAGRLDVVVAELVSELSRSRATALIKEGHVTVDGAVITRAAFKCPVDAEVTVEVPEPTPAEAVPQDLPLRIVFEDADLVVIDKDPGMVVHPGPGHPDGTLVNALLHHVGDLSGIGGVARPGIVHRLDRGTSGLLVVAKHDVAHRALAHQFADHSAGRRYVAVCLAVPDRPSGTIRSYLARHPRDRLRFASTEEGGKPAVTHWERLGAAHGMSLVGCRLETGRTHQVRVHLTEQGWPLAGDPLYRSGGRKPAPIVADRIAALGDRPLLHAWKLELTHPRTGERLAWLAPVPADMGAVIEALGLDDQVPGR